MKRRMWRHRERNYVWAPDRWEKKKRLEEEVPSEEEWEDE